jgi:hypothetical protein
MSSKKIERKNANDLYLECNCSEQFYKHSLGLIFTDGVATICDAEKCFWFLDICMSYNNANFRTQNEFQVWQLNRLAGDKFKVTCTDGNENILVTQIVPYSDFEQDDLTFYFTNNTLLLPSEN